MIDCLVIGSGPAGLSGAIQLGRLRRSTVLVDDEAGRSLWSQVTRNHLGFPGGVSAADLRLLGKEQAATFDVSLAAHLGATAATAVNYDLYDDVERGAGDRARKVTRHR